MSQAGINNSGVVPPVVPETFTADDGTIAIPVANNINVLSRFTEGDNDNGIQTTVDPNGSDDLFIELTNRVQGDGSTNQATTTDIITFSAGATPGTYTFECRVSAFESTTPAGAGYSLFGTVRTTGAAAVLIGTPDKIVNEEATLTAANADIVVSGNNIIVRVTGVLGLIINWNAVGLYTFVS